MKKIVFRGCQNCGLETPVEHLNEAFICESCNTMGTKFVTNAKVTYEYPDGAIVVECNGHKIQLGYGRGGDGYCYAHGSFDCIENLTEEEKKAIERA